MREVLLILATLLALLAVGAPLRALLRRWGVPPAASLIVLGVFLGPAATGVLPESWLDARPTLSAAAFVVLLLRAGMAIAPATLRAIAVPALLLGVVPVAAELAVATGLSRALLFPSWSMSLLAGFLVAAVSPAVILPAMLARQERVKDDPRSVSQLIMGQTLVNSLAATIGILITLEAIAPAPGGPGATRLLLLLPAALCLGAVLGTGLASVLCVDRWLDAGRQRHRVAAAFLVATGVGIYLGSARVAWVDGVTATLAFALALRGRLGRDDASLRDTLRQVWSVGEIVLFVNLGSAIRLGALADLGQVGLLLPLLAVALGVRVLVAAALCRRQSLVREERRLITVAHVPKATIQAVFGALPLLTFQQLRPDLVGDGATLLMLAALAIVTTAPVGAWAVERGMTARSPEARKSVGARQEPSRPEAPVSAPGTPAPVPLPEDGRPTEPAAAHTSG